MDARMDAEVPPAFESTLLGETYYEMYRKNCEYGSRFYLRKFPAISLTIHGTDLKSGSIIPGIRTGKAFQGVIMFCDYTK